MNWLRRMTLYQFVLIVLAAFCLGLMGRIVIGGTQHLASSMPDEWAPGEAMLLPPYPSHSGQSLHKIGNHPDWCITRLLDKKTGKTYCINVTEYGKPVDLDRNNMLSLMELGLPCHECPFIIPETDKWLAVSAGQVVL